MAVFTEFVDDEGGEPGISLVDLGRAVLTWGVMRNDATTVADAALTFNTTPESIRLALDSTMWVSWSGPDDDPAKQKLEFDGE